MKNIKSFRFGKNAEKVLRFSLPPMIFLIFILTLHVSRLESIALVKERETIFALLEMFSRMFVCVALGAVLADYAEKKSA